MDQGLSLHSHRLPLLTDSEMSNVHNATFVTCPQQPSFG